MYFASAVLALCVALFCTFFSFISGSGWLYLSPTAYSVLCLVGGIGVSVANPLMGACISGTGAGLCGLALIASMLTVAWVTPFHQHPEQASLLVAPGLFLLVMIAHFAIAVDKFRAINRK